MAKEIVWTNMLIVIVGASIVLSIGFLVLSDFDFLTGEFPKSIEAETNPIIDPDQVAPTPQSPVQETENEAPKTEVRTVAKILEPKQEVYVRDIINKDWNDVNDFVGSLRFGDMIEGLEEKAIQEYSSGTFSSIPCPELYFHYQIWYAGGESARHNLWSEYKVVTDYLVSKMDQNSCEAELRPEFKTQISDQAELIKKNTEELLLEMELINADN